MTLTTKDAETLESVLIDHRLTTPVQCTCGWREPDDGGTHAAHVRDALIASGAVRPAAEVRAEALRPIKALADEAMRRPIPGYISALQLRAALPEEADR